MAELMGKETGFCKGRGGSMHIADFGKGNLGANAIVGGGIPIATGAALSAKMRGTRQVSVAFFGDGASNQGIFHESLNLAAVWKLPAVYVCENNGFGISVPVRESTSVSDIAYARRLTASPARWLTATTDRRVRRRPAGPSAASAGGDQPSRVQDQRWFGTGQATAGVPDTGEGRGVEKKSRSRLRVELLARGLASAEALAKLETRAERRSAEAWSSRYRAPSPNPGA